MPTQKSLLRSNIEMVLPLAHQFDVPTLLHESKKVIEVWAASASICPFKNPMTQAPDKIWQTASELITFLWSNRVHVEQQLVNFLIENACRGEETEKLNIPEDCATILKEMQRIHYRDWTEQRKPDLTFNVDHESNEKYRVFLETEKTRLGNLYHDSGDRFFYACYPCAKSITKRASVAGCLHFAKYRCHNCDLLYCEGHRARCVRYMRQCRSCKQQRGPAFSAKDHCKCGYEEICKELLSKI